MNCASFIRLPFNRAWPIFLFLLLLGAGAPPSFAQAPDCSGFPKLHVLRSEPVQVNPGGRCRIATILFEFYEQQGFASYAVPTILDACLYVRRVGRAESIGPICNKKRGSIPLPVDLEYIWTTGTQLRATVTLVPKRR